MKVRLWLWTIFVGLASHAAAQQTANSASAPRYDTGTIANGIYSNDCLGFSIAIPPGWDLSKEQGDTETTKVGTHMPGGSIDLLTLDRHEAPAMANRIVLIAQHASRFDGTALDFVARAVHQFVDADPFRYELLQESSPVGYGGQQFYRADYKQKLQNGREMYLSYVFTKFRKYLLGEILMSGSAAALNEAANSLQHISFSTDQPNFACVVGDNMETGRMVGVIGAVASGKPSHMIVSSKVATGLLVQKVDPQYPEAARNAGARGPVVLKVTISKDGTVTNASAVSGDPKLVPAAMEAVKKWKFKPYMFNGEPVEVESSLAVTFEPLP